MSIEKLEFQAETKRLLDLVVNSIYTNKEIFLRELISNASDALDKLRIESLTNSELASDDEPEIFVVPDAATKTITISDNGIGMTREEVISNIGTIAKSGTKDFLDKLREASGSAAQELIGQFGVGFYSAFIVAEEVEILTRKAGTDSAVKWTSDGAGEYSIEDFDKETHGTTIVLHLKKDFCGDGEYNFTDAHEVERLIKKYSDFVRYPIKMNFEVKGKDEDKPEIEIRTVNSMKPLWTRNKSEITREEYDEFFKQQMHEWEAPLEVFHVKAEGTVEYTALLCIPKRAANNLYYSDYEAGLQLYSRHVFIMDKCKDFLPDYLRFVKGLVDSPDLPLNISREILQQSVEVKVIGKALEKNIQKQLGKMLKDDRDKYEEFWREFGKSLKIGVYNSMFDTKLKDALKDLLLFPTSNDGGKLSTLAEYVGRMPDFQKNIYVAAGKDASAIEQLPQMELLRERGLEVIYLTDPVDEFAIQVLHEYDEKHFQSITQENFELDDAESQKVKAEVEEIAKTHEDLLKDVKEAIGDDVKEVRLTSRLKSGAVCLVTGEGGPSLTMEKTFAAMNNPLFKATQILELNPNHAVFKKLESLHEGGKDSPAFKDLCTTLYALALLMEGVLPNNPADLANKVTELLTK
ncbi:MAG: molecular chaperone HtpG [Selenomonadaceae bacterium]|nr:molecular chaperone HtpG [Selenomonadaceae bacterium]